MLNVILRIYNVNYIFNVTFQIIFKIINEFGKNPFLYNIGNSLIDSYGALNAKKLDIIKYALV